MAGEEALTLARQQFATALEAVERGDEDTYRRLLPGLSGYVIADYLEYRWLTTQARVDTPAADWLDDYQRRYPGRFAERLRVQWLEALMQQRAWRAALVTARPQRSARERCYALQALYRLGGELSWSPSLREFWISTREFPEPCVEPLARLLAQRPPGHRTVWDRIYRAFEHGDTGTAAQASQWLNEADRDWVQLWTSAHAEPETALTDPRLGPDTLLARRIIAHAVRRLARDDAPRAAVVWAERHPAYIYSPEQVAEVERFIALRAAWQRVPEAYTLLSAIAPAQRDRQVRAWRARAALRAEDWSALHDSVMDMPSAQRKEERWQYWQGRALRRLGQEDVARARFSELASETTYYGFLAADRLAQPYRFNHEPASIEPARVDALLSHPHVQRAREFLWHRLAVEARREWRTALRDFDDAQKLAAAVLAHRWDWHDRAVYTIAATRYRRDYVLRFPMPFAEQVATASQAFALEPSLIYGVLRRESAYRADARSRAGALGLMQLMPSTARGVARALGTHVNGGDLLRADVNIRFGSKYFRDMLDRFDNHQVLAAAAYNAGPHRVDRWLPRAQPVAADAWIDTMPFGETRRYVRAVLAYTTIFRWRRGQDVVSLRERMPDIPPALESQPAG